jgi:hypothetical protein
MDMEHTNNKCTPSLGVGARVEGGSVVLEEG